MLPVATDRATVGKPSSYVPPPGRLFSADPCAGIGVFTPFLWQTGKGLRSRKRYNTEKVSANPSQNDPRPGWFQSQRESRFATIAKVRSNRRAGETATAIGRHGNSTGHDRPAEGFIRWAGIPTGWRRSVAGRADQFECPPECDNESATAAYQEANQPYAHQR